MLEALKKPLPAEAVSTNEIRPYLSSIKAIFVVERLNEVFGLGGWFINNEIVEQTENIVVKSTFHCPEYGIIIPDIFGGNDNPDRGDAYKGACTDALTKIGSYLYVGMDVFKGLANTEKWDFDKKNKKWIKQGTEKQEKQEKQEFDPEKSKILFGKFTGKLYKDLPADYLNWLNKKGNEEEKAKLKILSEYLKKSPENEEQEDEKQETMNGDPIYEDDLPF